MATSEFSILRQYAPYTSPYNIDLIKDVAMYKQGKVDASRDKINQQIDYLMGQDIVKPEARAYMEEKMQGIINNVNKKYSGVDLSSDGIARSIQGDISQVLDNTVINAIAGTKEGRRMQKILSEKQLNGDADYSAMNGYVAMKPFYEWSNDGKAGSRLNPLQYTPYVDYNKEARTVMESIKNNNRGGKVDIPILDKDGNPTGAVQEISYDALTPRQASQIGLLNLSPAARNQMDVEAVYMADSNPAAFSLDSVKTFMSSQVSDLQSYINGLEADLKGVGSDESKKQRIESELNRAKNELGSSRMTLDGLSPESYQTYMGAKMVVESNFKNNMASTWAYDNTSSIIKKDEMYWAQKDYEQKTRNYNLQTAKLEAETNYRMLMYGLKAGETESDIALNQARAAKLLAGAGAGAGEVTVGGLPISSSAGALTVQTGRIDNIEDLNINDSITKAFEEDYRSQKVSYSQLSSAMTVSDLDQINAAISERRKNPTSGYSNLSEEEAIFKYLSENGGLANKVFSNIKGTVGVGADKRSKAVIAQEAFVQLGKSNSKMNIHNDRINEERALYTESINQSFDNVSERLRTSDVLKVSDRFVAKALKDAYKPIERNTDLNKYIGTTYLTFESINNMSNQLGVVNDRLKATDPDSNPSQFNIWDYFDLDEEKGMYKLNENADSSQVMKLLRDNMVGHGSKTMTNISTKANVVENYSDYDSINSKKNEIRKSYIKTEIPDRFVVSAGLPEKSEFKGVERALSNIYSDNVSEFPVNENNQPSKVNSYTIVSKGLNVNGVETYSITANHNGVRRDSDSFEITAADLSKAGLPMGGMSGDIPIGSYKTDLRPVHFAAEEDSEYAAILRNNNINDVYATPLSSKEMALNAMSSIYLEPEKKQYVESNLMKVMDNYSMFATNIEGFDSNLSQRGNGYKVSLYYIGDGTSATKPEKITDYEVNGVSYADDVDRINTIAPQREFVDIVISAFMTESNNMSNTGANAFRKGSQAQRLLEAIDKNKQTTGGSENGRESE